MIYVSDAQLVGQTAEITFRVPGLARASLELRFFDDARGLDLVAGEGSRSVSITVGRSVYLGSTPDRAITTLSRPHTDAVVLFAGVQEIVTVTPGVAALVVEVSTDGYTPAGALTYRLVLETR